MFAIPSSHFQTYSPYASSSYGPSLYYPQQRTPRTSRPYSFIDDEEDDDDYQAYLYHKQLEERKRQAALARAKQQRVQQEEQAYIQAIQRQQAKLRQQQELERAYYEQLRAREAALYAQSAELEVPAEQEQEEEGVEMAQEPSHTAHEAEQQLPPSSRLSYDQAVEVVQRHAKAQLNIRKRIKALSSIRARLVSARQAFQMPASLNFDTLKSTSSHPVLSYDAVNRPVRAYEETLLRFLLDVDEVGSAGSERVKKERKALVAEIEKEMGRLDGLKVEEWKKQNSVQEREGAELEG